MFDRIENEALQADLKLPWLVMSVMLTSLLVYLLVCHSFSGIQQHLPEAQRELIRTVFYVLAIMTLPMTNLLRHIQLRLNQTMPGDKPAKSRYLLTIIVSMGLVETIGVFGFVMFLLGDSFNTLYIFTGMSALGMYLYRPKLAEYAEVVEKLAAQQD
ncbi:MAG: hypothetical protein ABL925_21650 [Methylococcales bacterium]